MAKFEGRPTWNAVRWHWLRVHEAAELRRAASADPIVRSYLHGELSEAEAVERFLHLLHRRDVRPAA